MKKKDIHLNIPKAVILMVVFFSVLLCDEVFAVQRNEDVWAENSNSGPREYQYNSSSDKQGRYSSLLGPYTPPPLPNAEDRRLKEQLKNDMTRLYGAGVDPFPNKKTLKRTQGDDDALKSFFVEVPPSQNALERQGSSDESPKREKKKSQRLYVPGVDPLSKTLECTQGDDDALKSFFVEVPPNQNVLERKGGSDESPKREKKKPQLSRQSWLFILFCLGGGILYALQEPDAKENERNQSSCQAQTKTDRKIFFVKEWKEKEQGKQAQNRIHRKECPAQTEEKYNPGSKRPETTTTPIVRKEQPEGPSANDMTSSQNNHSLAPPRSVKKKDKRTAYNTSVTQNPPTHSSEKPYLMMLLVLLLLFAALVVIFVFKKN